MKIQILIAFFFFFCTASYAQVKDSLKSDSAKPARRSYESLFANDDTLTRNDYLLSIGKIFQILNEASAAAQPVPFIKEINNRLDEDDSALNIIKDRVTISDRGLNVRNLQMFSILLEEMNKNTLQFSKDLAGYDSTLDRVKRKILEIRKDTVIRHLFRDTVMRASFKPQLTELRAKWRKTDSLLKYVNTLINNTEAPASNNLIATSEIQLKAQGLEQSVGSRAFSKERRYLWESSPPRKNISQSFSGRFKRTLQSERKISQYYFSHTHNQFMLLFLSGIIFFFWIFFNFISLKKNKSEDSIIPFHFRYIDAVPFFASIVFMLNLAPLFDLNAPFVYIEFIEFLMIIVLSVSFWKRLPRKLFYFWILFILLYFSQSFLKYMGLPFYLNRWASLLLNSLSFLFGIYMLALYRKKFQNYKALAITMGLYTLFNLLAVLCNLFGRVTLMQIFASTGTYALIQTVALIVFVGSVTEALMLQIQSSRVRKEYKTSFDHEAIAKGITKLITFLAIIIWLVVFFTNLNLYNVISDQVTAVLKTPRNVGNFSFTLGGIILFLLIMWAANFLQKYIAYFFGDVGDDSAFDNTNQRSRLVVTRLVLLIAGFFLAVAASGLAIDRVTIILGALSVGIGLGLQNIVSNFISGIILIFDRTIRIGDTVEIGDKKGRVKEISMRSSTLLTPEGAEVIIPNGEILSHQFVNWSLSNNYMRVDVSYNIEQASVSEDIVKDLTGIIKNEPQVLSSKEPEIIMNPLGPQSSQLKIYFWCRDVNKIEFVRSNVYASIYRHLEEKGILIK